jgi:hypothetical protein
MPQAILSGFVSIHYGVIIVYCLLLGIVAGRPVEQVAIYYYPHNSQKIKQDEMVLAIYA